MEIFLLSIFGFALGIINAISGGGGVLALPLFLALGLTPINAIAMNVISDAGVVLGVMHNYFRSKEINWKFALSIGPLLFCGSIFGAKTIVNLSPELIKTIILVGVSIGIFFLLKPIKKLDIENKRAKWVTILGYFLFFLLGIWEGSIAIAGGTFALIIMAQMFGKSFLQGRTALAAAGTPGVIISAIILYHGSTLGYAWPLAILLSNFAGAWVGSHLALKHGDGLIRKCMVAMSIVIVVKLIFLDGNLLSF